jgi:peptidoglycan-N-acetylglucosamine deacetylase
MNKLALTYDDGPNGVCTEPLLYMLEMYKVPATFFLTGMSAHDYPELVQSIRKYGHTIGNHTSCHPDLRYLDALRTFTEILLCEDVLGEHASIFRPPYGYTNASLAGVLADLKMKEVLWDIDSFDWQGLTALDICKVVDEQIGGGGIILMHDADFSRRNADRRATLDATETIIKKYRNNFEFVSVLDMPLPGTPRKTAL